MRRLTVAVVAVAAVAALALGVHASASQLLVTSRSMTQTMVASVVAPITMALTNGGAVAGQAENLDRLVITFGRPLDASTMCAAWPAAPTTTQVIAANNAVTVSVSDGGAGADVLTVSTTACGTPFTLGSVSLGSTAFTSGGSLLFAGNGDGRRSTISYDPATAQLVITLGQRGGTGIAGTAGAVTATFTPAAGLLHGDGSSVLPATAATTGVLL